MVKAVAIKEAEEGQRRTRRSRRTRGGQGGGQGGQGGGQGGGGQGGQESGMKISGKKFHVNNYQLPILTINNEKIAAFGCDYPRRMPNIDNDKKNKHKNKLCHSSRKN